MFKLISSAALGLSVVSFLALAAGPASANSQHSNFGVSVVVKDFSNHSFTHRGARHDRFDRFDRRSRFGGAAHPSDFARSRFHQQRFNRFDRGHRFGGHRSKLVKKFIFSRR
jgi:hypothetical protein